MENLLELDVEVYKSAELYCDHLEGTRSEFSTLASRGIEFGAEIGDVIAGKVKPAFSDGITVFQSIGKFVICNRGEKGNFHFARIRLVFFPKAS